MAFRHLIAAGLKIAAGAETGLACERNLCFSDY